VILGKVTCISLFEIPKREKTFSYVGKDHFLSRK